jgi:hypothetical protein
MAIFVMTGSCLHVKLNDETVLIIFLDFKNYFNTSWKALIEVLEWEKLGIKGTRWDLSRQMGENIQYRVKFHGHYTATIPQREGHTQGSLSSPKKCNLLSGAFAEELERRQLGIKVGGKPILGAAW